MGHRTEAFDIAEAFGVDGTVSDVARRHDVLPQADLCLAKEVIATRIEISGTVNLWVSDQGRTVRTMIRRPEDERFHSTSASRPLAAHLHMLQIGAVQIFQDPMVAGTNDIQELSKTHDAVSRAKTELWHRILTHYLPLYFSEADRFHRSSRTDWFLAFLEMFPSPHMITVMTKDEFIKTAWEVVGGKWRSLSCCQIFTRQQRHQQDCPCRQIQTPSACSA